MTQDELRFDVGRVLLVAMLIIAAGFACLAFDMPLARLVAKDIAPRELQAILDRAEVFGHAYGIAIIGLTIWFVSPAKRLWLPRFFFATYGAGLAADIIKLAVWRYRPCSYDLSGGVSDSFAGSIFTTAGHDIGAMIQSSHHSLPSAHTASAIAAALVLGRIYPHASRWFLVLGALVAANRVEGGAHFASDVCWGAAVGFIVYALALNGGWLQSLLLKLENLIANASQSSAALRDGAA